MQGKKHILKSLSLVQHAKKTNKKTKQKNKLVTLDKPVPITSRKKEK